MAGRDCTDTGTKTTCIALSLMLSLILHSGELLPGLSALGVAVRFSRCSALPVRELSQNISKLSPLGEFRVLSSTVHANRSPPLDPH